MLPKNYFCGVKLLTVLLAFYILLLPGIPCTDTNEGNLQAQAQCVTSSSHEDHENKEEGCNPFCNCTCCGQIFTPVFFPLKTIAVKPITKKRRHFYAADGFLPGYYGTIWQPPKLS